MRRYRHWLLTEGTIVKTTLGSEEEIIIHILYSVDGKQYISQEYLRCKKQAVMKLGPIPIGYKSIPTLFMIANGTKIPVLYDSKNPKKSHIQGNDGRIY